ncbi:MAG: A/G-specific adenine glycosylase [Devosiaceae bacterium]
MTSLPQVGDVLAGQILSWYDKHARALPWRIGPTASKAGKRQDPYKTWLSEIMLQQTTVAAVIPYFEKFIVRWPTVQALAAASDDDVRAAWAGLGYYRRAANLHACAKVVAYEHGGKFPTRARELKNLPGIGDYTSAAIASIAFGEPAAVVDGNVERVVTRLFRLSDPLPKVKRQVGEKVTTMLDVARPGDFAQAMMDLGATICTPKNPACSLCPWNSACKAFEAGDMEAYPVKAPKKEKPKRLGAALVVVRKDGSVWCEKRPDGGLLPNMTQVPTTQWSAEVSSPYQDAERVGTIEHVFTHFALTLDVYRRDSDTAPTPDGWWSPPDRLANEAWPTVMVKVLKAAVPKVATGIRAKKV